MIWMFFRIQNIPITFSYNSSAVGVTEAVALMLTSPCVRAAFPYIHNSTLIATFRSSGKNEPIGIPNGSFLPLYIVLETA